MVALPSLVLRDPTKSGVWRDNLDDAGRALREWRLWSNLAWYDIRLRYRRSYIGPFWITLSLAITISGMSFVFGAVFQTSMGDLMPHVAAGMLLWLTISSVVTEGCSVFVANTGIIKEMPLSVTLHSLRLLTRSGIIMAHHLVIMLVVIPLFGVPVTWATLLVLPGLALYAVNGFWIIQFFGTLTARFRDIQQITQSILQLALFVTPVFWKPDFLAGRRSYIVDWNPFAHMIAVVRQPLLGEAPSILNYAVTIGITGAGLVAATILFGRFSRRIVYWL